MHSLLSFSNGSRVLPSNQLMVCILCVFHLLLGGLLLSSSQAQSVEFWAFDMQSGEPLEGTHFACGRLDTAAKTDDHGYVYLESPHYATVTEIRVNPANSDPHFSDYGYLRFEGQWSAEDQRLRFFVALRRLQPGADPWEGGRGVLFTSLLGLSRGLFERGEEYWKSSRRLLSMILADSEEYPKEYRKAHRLSRIIDRILARRARISVPSGVRTMGLWLMDGETGDPPMDDELWSHISVETQDDDLMGEDGSPDSKGFLQLYIPSNMGAPVKRIVGVGASTIEYHEFHIDFPESPPVLAKEIWIAVFRSSKTYRRGFHALSLHEMHDLLLARNLSESARRLRERFPERFLDCPEEDALAVTEDAIMVKVWVYNRENQRPLHGAQVIAHFGYSMEDETPLDTEEGQTDPDGYVELIGDSAGGLRVDVSIEGFENASRAWTFVEQGKTVQAVFHIKHE